MDKLRGTGIIARIESPQLAKAVMAAKVPVIALDLTHEQLAPGHPLAAVCEVCPNSEQAAALAAEHLLDQGLRQFAFVGVPNDPLWSTRAPGRLLPSLGRGGTIVPDLSPARPPQVARMDSGTPAHEPVASFASRAHRAAGVRR